MTIVQDNKSMYLLAKMGICQAAAEHAIRI